jgi:hypothetical protein
MTGPGLHWLASYPKSGNTWFRVVLRAYLDGADDEIDLNRLQTGLIGSSRLWVDDVVGFDTADLYPSEIDRMRPLAYRWYALQDGFGGYHKIHDAFLRNDDGAPLVDPQATNGAVYIVRNPLDIVPSLAAHLSITLDEAVDVMGNPDAALANTARGLNPQLRQRLCTWSGHVESWVDATEIPVHVLRYEDMHGTPRESFAAALAFLGLRGEDERVARAISLAGFDRLVHLETTRGFRERPASMARFFRSGRTGDWRSTLQERQVARIVSDHAPVMRRFGYLDKDGEPV